MVNKGDAMTEPKIEPITASADGKRNAYYLTCDVHGQIRPYVACISIHERRKEELIQSLYASCMVAIERRKCPAVDMREKELLEGKAIFFTERVLSGPATKTAVQLQEFIGAVERQVSEDRKIGDEVDVFLGASRSGYADAINAELAKRPAPVNLLPGETPLEAARRILKERNPPETGTV